MTQTVNIKAGATFSVPLLVRLPSGNWSATSEMRQSDTSLVGVLSVTLASLAEPDAAGNTHSGLLLATSVQTASWPVGAFRCDVRFADTQDPPVVLFSDPFVVDVTQGMTHG